jgi:hypothetical protein
VLLLNECLLFLFISLSTQSGNFWIHPRISTIWIGMTFFLLTAGKNQPTPCLNIWLLWFWALIQPWKPLSDLQQQFAWDLDPLQVPEECRMSERAPTGHFACSQQVRVFWVPSCAHSPQSRGDTVQMCSYVMRAAFRYTQMITNDRSTLRLLRVAEQLVKGTAASQAKRWSKKWNVFTVRRLHVCLNQHREMSCR